MPRNGSGTFSVENPIVVGALRSSSVVNANFTDMGDEITNSLPIDGQAGMSGQFKAAVLAQTGAPGITWADDTNTGFRRTGTDAMAWVGGSQDRATMDANGKLTLEGGLDVAGTFSHTTGFGPQTLEVSATSSTPVLTLRNTSNDTDEHVLAKYQSGSGSGASGELRMVGGGANDVATMRFYVNDVLAFQWTGSLFTHSLDTLFGASGIRADTDGFLDFPELSAAPSVPSSNIARLYAKDDSGTTRLYYKDASGNESAFQPQVVRQSFTSSGTWTKPTQGQTTALIECWGGGGGGSNGGNDAGGGGGAGGAYSRRIVALASLSASVSVTVGSGGAGRTFDAGGTGGQTSFGAYLSAYGGGGGDHGDDSDGGGGGGGLTEAGDQGGNGPGGDGGAPNGLLGSETWGAGGADGSDGECNPFGGGGGGGGTLIFGSGEGGTALWGGGGGGGNGVNNINAANGGNSVFGGGGGGGGADTATKGAGGTSIFGGNGGEGGEDSGDAGEDGSAPAGGGGGGGGISGGGDGARGEVRVTVW